MKKSLVMIAVLVVLGTITRVQAQDKGQIRVSAALAMGTKAAISDTGGEKLGMGINIGGDYFVIDKLAISPSYTFFFKSSVGSGTTGEVSLKVSSFNVDAKYYFLTNGVNLYGIGGLSFATAKATVSIPDFGLGFGGLNTTAKDNKVGVNIGAGVDFGLGEKLFLNGQVKYNTPIEQLVINLGVGFIIK